MCLQLEEHMQKSVRKATWAGEEEGEEVLLGGEAEEVGREDAAEGEAEGAEGVEGVGALHRPQERRQ